MFYRFPFIACEIFTCEVDVILNTLVEDDEVCKAYILFSLAWNLMFTILIPKTIMVCLNSFYLIVLIAFFLCYL